MIEQILLVSDVDGVVREGVQSMADPGVILAIIELLVKENVQIIFISGTAVVTDFSLESWRRGNVSLSTVFQGLFQEEMKSNKVSIYGVLGGQKMTPDGGMVIVDVYPLETSFEIGKLLVEAFLREAIHHGTTSQKSFAEELMDKVTSLELKDTSQSLVVTPLEFRDIVEKIRANLDPEFKLISNGALIETHTSSPPWDTTLSVDWLKKEIKNPSRPISSIDSEEIHIAHGLCKRTVGGFHFLMISKMNKGMTIKKHIERNPGLADALLVTIGDTQVDYPMHETADLAFHVGLEKVWKSNPLEQCVMVRDEEGRDSQHLMGTVKIVNIIQNSLGKTLHELKYTFKEDEFGGWNWHSSNDQE